MSIQEKLLAIQSKLHAPKSQRNAFGNYNYRNCEDILEALKPLLLEQGCTLILSDSVELIGTRFYVKATAQLRSSESNPMQPSCVECYAYAREEETRKGMDGSQITGSSSSYARKYALNGLFLIDDTKDADTMDNRSEAVRKPVTPVARKTTAVVASTMAPATRTTVMEFLTACKKMDDLERVYERACQHDWSTEDGEAIAECFQNMQRKLTPVPKAA